MRIAVLELVRRQQRTGFAQRGADGALRVIELIRNDIALALQPQPVGPVGAIGAIAENGEHWVDAVGLAEGEIILAMVGRHVDEAGALLGGDEITGQERARAGVSSLERSMPRSATSIAANETTRAIGPA